MRMMTAALAAGLLAGVPAASTAQAAETIKIGVIATLSGPPAALGEQVRDGMRLAIDDLGGRVGGLEAELIVEDDELKPEVAITKAQKLVGSDAVDVVVGTVFSNMLQAIFKPVVQSGTWLISPNAGPSTFAGRNCHEDFFAVSYQNDQNAEAAGAYASAQGFERVFLLAPNYQAGRDQIEGFKRRFDGEIAGEVYTPLGHKDFSAEIARIADAEPDALYTFMPGGMGVRLVGQFRTAGLAERIAFLSAFTVDETTLPAQKDDALGMMSFGNWAPDYNNDRSLAFVADFIDRYGYVPGGYAMQGYDTVMLLDGAIRETGGDLSDKDALREALRAARFQSLRGDFAFNVNHYPIQNFYVMRVGRREGGAYQTEVEAVVLDDAEDAFHEECRMEP